MSALEAALPGGIRLVDDLHLGRPQVIGTYVLLGDEPAVVDPGPTSTLATLEQGLEAIGLGLEDLRAVLLTHIHLDHAGASGSIAALNPNVRVYVHPRGAPHMVNPEKLIRSATMLYGDLMEYLWGDFRPVPQDRVVVVGEGDRVRLGGRELRVLDAPGHASHHVIYFEEASGAAFVGDNAGVRLPGFRYARPATPPPDIDIETWCRTLDRLAELRPQVLLPTHFGPADGPQEHIAAYRERLWKWAELVREGLAGGGDEAAQIARLQAAADAELDADAEGRARYQQATPLEQSWQGLARYWRKRAG
jgi:glyoxylase-like metal-dependent hydrolase (beta-lactamase superfamily II)